MRTPPALPTALSVVALTDVACISSTDQLDVVLWCGLAAAMCGLLLVAQLDRYLVGLWPTP